MITWRFTYIFSSVVAITGFVFFILFKLGFWASLILAIALFFFMVAVTNPEYIRRKNRDYERRHNAYVDEMGREDARNHFRNRVQYTNPTLGPGPIKKYVLGRIRRK